MGTNEEIKMGTKNQNNGLPTQVIHTGTLKESPILVVSKIGMENKISNESKTDIVNQYNITKEIDKFEFYKLLDACAEDLKAKRKVLVNGKEEVIELIAYYDNRNTLFKFNYDNNFLNEVFNLKNNDLADFLSNFLFTNINTYSHNIFGAIPEVLPLVSMDERVGNLVGISIH